MSHSATITQTVTRMSTPAWIVLNTGYLKTWSGILKLLQLALGIVCIGIAGHAFSDISYYRDILIIIVIRRTELFFLIITTTFVIGTFVLLLSCLISFSTASIISKTVYELLYHSIAFGLLLAASLTLMVEINRRLYYRSYDTYKSLLGASICGLVNAGLYLFSAIIAFRTYREI